MATISLTDYITELGPKTGFSPDPVIDDGSDTLSMQFENTPSYAQRVDSFLTVFHSIETHEIVGFCLKGIMRALNELGGLIITADTPKVHVNLILKICANREGRANEYESLANRASRFSNAAIPLPRSKKPMYSI